MKRLLCIRTATGDEWILAANGFYFRFLDEYEIPGVVVASIRRPGKSSGRGAEADRATAEYLATTQAGHHPKTVGA